jgi:hypothetical protein
MAKGDGLTNGAPLGHERFTISISPPNLKTLMIQSYYERKYNYKAGH